VAALVVILLLLLLALFGVSYAAAVLAATLKPSTSGSLGNNAGDTLRTANAALPGVVLVPRAPGRAPTAGCTRTELPPSVFAHRRSLAFEVTPAGRRVAVTSDSADTVGVPPPLLLLANTSGRIASLSVTW
jgi:hypothetical protein